ncbi:glutamyl-tRNA reductase [Wenzhouxiangella marina]|uniref:glutamyl-tRNA reductase n=1 Tax=Wenzhouxiangella marina TaxID=1579979 RepID=UPI0014707181|nr:glutamyl-tRNA reductase [Wenzhouxiangella marina]MBB6086466.1 glutamyl-tRNA reductase [Wenzhouxiangella marina]
MSLFVLGISHQTAPIAIRERLAFAAERLPDALQSLAAVPSVEGCAILSTCNRTELYLSGSQTTMREAADWLHQWHGLGIGQYQEHLYQLEGSASLFHLIKVVSGADSMIIGEPQVAGQVKQSWQQANDASTLDTRLDRMFQHAFAGAKRVRSETGIGRDPVTLPFAALRLARQIFGPLEGRSALLVGAGEMIEDCATHFNDSGMGQLTIVNRSIERARALAERFSAASHGLDALPSLLPQHDLLIACTASPEAVVTRDMLDRAIGERRHRPLFALDLAVPRNIAPDSSDLDDLFLYTIDDLHEIIEKNQQRRQDALRHAMDLIDSEVIAFERWLHLHESSTTLKQLRRQAQGERDRLLDEARAQIAAGQNPEDVLQRFGHRLVNRLLHGPSIRLRQAAEQADKDLLAAARFFFEDDPA